MQIDLNGGLLNKTQLPQRVGSSSAQLRSNDVRDVRIRTLPASHYHFKPHDGVGNFAKQLLHLTQVTATMASVGGDFPSPFEKGEALEQNGSVRNKDSVLHCLAVGYDFVLEAIAKMDWEKMNETVADRKLTATRFGWLQKAFARQTHHRGQTTLYLRLCGIKPPAWTE